MLVNGSVLESLEVPDAMTIVLLIAGIVLLTLGAELLIRSASARADPRSTLTSLLRR